MEAEVLNLCIRAFRCALHNNLAGAVDDLLCSIGQPRCRSFLEKLINGAYSSPEEWIGDVTWSMNKIANSVGSSTPEGLCILSVMKDIQEAGESVIGKLVSSSDYHMELLDMAIMELKNMEIPNTLEEFQADHPRAPCYKQTTRCPINTRPLDGQAMNNLARALNQLQATCERDRMKAQRVKEIVERSGVEVVGDRSGFRGFDMKELTMDTYVKILQEIQDYSSYSSEEKEEEEECVSS
jgi:hypothetical protein